MEKLCIKIGAWANKYGEITDGPKFGDIVQVRSSKFIPKYFLVEGYEDPLGLPLAFNKQWFVDPVTDQEVEECQKENLAFC